MADSITSDNSPTSSNSSTPAQNRGRPSVQALLAELSDSDDDVRNASPSRQKEDVIRKVIQTLSEDDSSEDDLPIGGGRLASRLVGGTIRLAPEQQVTGLTDAVQFEMQKTSSSQREANGDEETIEPKRKFLLKRKRAAEDTGESRSYSQNQSPIFQRQNTPTPSRSASSVSHGRSPSPPSEKQQAPAAGSSRFQQLVEKARKEREAREKAEKAKKEAVIAQQSTVNAPTKRQRGSSPADDSAEDSDASNEGAAVRLTKEARPTRKASKKAIEEMNRETQRMTRNMQLAHQARTKKKFTKESFLASFNGSLPSVSEVLEDRQDPRISDNLVFSSDAEHERLHSTPLTSPLRSPVLNKTNDLPVAEKSSNGVAQTTDVVDDADDFEDLFASRRAANDTAFVDKNTLQPGGRDHRIRPISAFNVQVEDAISRDDSDSGSDIEVVHEKGHRRKFVAFENLPKRRAKETPSHLALRSLAHVKHDKDKKSVMSRAEMGPSLLRAARKQAFEERREKIEKLRAAGVIIQTAEEKEQDEEELENILERARQADEEIRKREKELAKKEGTYVKDALDDEDSDEEDEDFQDEEQENGSDSDSNDEDGQADDEGDGDEVQDISHPLLDSEAEESDEEGGSEDDDEEVNDAEKEGKILTATTPIPSRLSRQARIVLDDDEDDLEESLSLRTKSPVLPSARKTPQSILRSTRKIIPGLQHSDDLPIGLTQAFAATMAESQTQVVDQSQEQDSMNVLRDLPSPFVHKVPNLERLDSIDMITESVPSTQTQPLGLNLDLSQSQRVPDSPILTRPATASQMTFELTQDAGYSFSPFTGNRFAETPRREPHSTEETVLLEGDVNSPIVQKKGRLQRGRQASAEAEDQNANNQRKTVFQVMSKAAKRNAIAEFNKKKSEARQAVDEAAEESDDEYAGLGGASDDDSNDEENEDDRNMIDQDTQVGRGDEAKLAKLHADREREADEAAVNKMMKDITTGALRRKRGAGDDLNLSDEEDAVSRRREAKRREFAKMRREMLKDEAVGKIAEDKKKEAFLKSIEDRDNDDEEDDLDAGVAEEMELQEQSQQDLNPSTSNVESSKALRRTRDTQLNQLRPHIRRTQALVSQKPGTLAEIRESVSFLIEEPDSQAGVIDLGLSDSEEEPEAYVNLDRHLQQAEADEDAMNDENQDLGDFVVDDEEDESTTTDNAAFKKPDIPTKEGGRAPFSERRTNAANVIDRLSLLRQSSSSSASGSNASSKMAFFSSNGGSRSLSNIPSLLRRATTNSSLGSMSGRENVSATGVVTSKTETERGSAASEKDYVRKGASTSRNAVNYQGRQNLKEEKMSARAGIVKKQQNKKKSSGGFLGSLFRGNTWD